MPHLWRAVLESTELELVQNVTRTEAEPGQVAFTPDAATEIVNRY